MASLRCIRSLKTKTPIPVPGCSRAVHYSSNTHRPKSERRPYEQLQPTTSARIRYRVQEGGNRLPAWERENRYSLGLPEEHFTGHLNGLFAGLDFPPELAQRILTHASHPSASRGHNGSLVFLGRRVMESYLLLFFTSSPKLSPEMDFDHLVEKCINTYTLGQHVGSQWGLGRVLAWTPTVAKDKLRSEQDQVELLRSVGLYKVQGDAVFAVMGGIYFQFGAAVALRVFHTRLIPHLLDHVIPETFHDSARKTLREMGGTEGPLLTPLKAQENATKAVENSSKAVEQQPQKEREEDPAWLGSGVVGIDVPFGGGGRAYTRQPAVASREAPLRMATA